MLLINEREHAAAIESNWLFKFIFGPFISIETCMYGNLLQLLFFQTN